MLRSLRVLGAGLMLLSASTAFAANTIEFQNQSDWAIHELYLSPTKADKWGPDQLTDHVIKKGEKFTLNGVPVGKYDMRLVDEDGDECIVSAITIAESEAVAITNENLVGCQAATANNKEGDEEGEE